MPEQQAENVVRRDEFSAAIYGADAVAIAISGEPGVVSAIAYRLLQRAKLRFDRLGIHSAKKWIASAANFVAGDAVPREKFAKQSARGAVHRVNEQAEFVTFDAIPV